MVRTRVIQTLFAYYKDSAKTATTAQKELTKSFADTYDLYFLLLDFALNVFFLAVNFEATFLMTIFAVTDEAR